MWYEIKLTIMSKSIKELGAIVRHMYESATRKELVARVHLSGILYHKEIRLAGVKEVTHASGIGEKYGAEINKGVKLGQYVTVSPEVKTQLNLPHS